MKKYILLALLIAGCTTVDPREAKIHHIAVQVFGNDERVDTFEVESGAPVAGNASNADSSNEVALADALLPGATRGLDLAVWSDSSAHTAAVLWRALQNPSLAKLPHLRLLFVGNREDAERVRPAVEATGAKFYFHEN